MSAVGQVERAVQNRVIRFFTGKLAYEYLGNWQHGERTSGGETALLRANLVARGYDDVLISRALHELGKAAAVGAGRSLYEANRDVYGLLRYGVHVKRSAGEQNETVHLVDLDHPSANHFAIAEEVTVARRNGGHKRPDLVLYLNGLAIATLELKRSKVAVSEGIRQTIGNQDKDFIAHFFPTVQLAFAGNDVEGLRYAPIDTPEKYWLTWKEPAPAEGGIAPVGDGPLDATLLRRLATQAGSCDASERRPG